jgi:glycosyltransferase involved in cell wall biosynthesis
MTSRLNGSVPVTIGVPVYNGERLLPRALDSLLAQTFSNFEIIISDNASTDGTAEIGLDYARRDPRVCFVRQERNLGAALNFNYVFQQSHGRYFKWMAHDDVIDPTYLSVCVDALAADPAAVLCYTGTALINDDGTALYFDLARQAFIDRYAKPWYWSSRPDVETSLPDPVPRFSSVVLRNGWCLEVFGLIRSDALRRSSLIGRYYGSDKILLAELATIGHFHADQRALFLRGCQPEQSSYLTPQQQAAWIRGSNKGITLDQAWMLLGLIKAGWRRELTLPQRAACTGAVVRQALKAEKFKRLFLPGPNNYFGIRGRSRG